MESSVLEKLLQYAAEKGASDVHLKPGRPPIFRKDGRLVAHRGGSLLSSNAILRVLDETLSSSQRDTLESRGALDIAHELSSGQRFRIHFYSCAGSYGLAIRCVPSTSDLSIDSLNLPASVARLADAPRGLILVTGASGNGKSTTVAALIDYINRSRSAHIVTIEEPIEFAFKEKKAIFSQREIGVDAPSFPEALRAALRQDPDVIVVGEIRDTETVRTALHAAETGHLVISTLHTIDAVETVQRITSMFPGEERDTVRHILSSVLHGVVSQRLVPTADGASRVPAVEVLVNSPHVKELLQSAARESEVRDAISAGASTYGMQSFDQSLMNLFQNELITYDEALRQSTNPSDFALKISGISGTSDKNWAG